MALITCPECQQQVSDQATTCPKCGFPLSTIGNPSDTQTEESAVSKQPTRKKPFIIAIIAFVCIVSVVLAGVFVKKAADEKAAAEAYAAAEQASIEARETYISNLESFVAMVLNGGAKAEGLCNLTRNVWHDSIFEEYDSETAKYTRHNGEYWDDFNDALRALYCDDETLKTIDEIENSQEEARNLYKALQDPAEEFEKCFRLVDELYSVFFNLTNLATSPSGSLTTYTENFNEYESEFLELYEKLELLIPEK